MGKVAVAIVLRMHRIADFGVVQIRGAMFIQVLHKNFLSEVHRLGGLLMQRGQDAMARLKR